MFYGESGKQLFIDMICDFINNTESEDHIKLSDKEVEDIAGKIVNDVMDDQELNDTVKDTIEWYVNREIYYKECR